MTYKPNRTVGFIRRNLSIGATSLKDRSYFTFLRPLVKYASTVWDPYTQTRIQKIEMVQQRAARYVKHKHRNTSSVSDILRTMNWRSLQERRRDAWLCMHYKIVRNLVAFKKPNASIFPREEPGTLMYMKEPTRHWAAGQTEGSINSCQEQLVTGMRSLQSLAAFKAQVTKLTY